ncbi:MAG: sigma-70 family RNA polymerase sigma factor [Myxococcota bacterium]|nr:sigma-70 family RNA polymerase sigma factor [Myxococcota bacterium]MEE2779502.1 sigma-70 family RNA polymerase sigma factor [Myxococcota bacterium]
MDPSQLEDPHFIQSLRAGESWAFEQLVRCTQNRLYNAVYRLLGSPEEAKDVLQEVYLTVHRKLHLFRGESKLTTWLYRVATNHARNRIKYLSRRKDRYQDSFDDMLAPPSEGRLSAQIHRPDQSAESRQLERVLAQALCKLDPDQRAAVVLRDIEGLTYEEIAEILSVQLGTVKSRIHRGRSILKNAVLAWQRGDHVELTPTGEMPGGLLEVVNQWTSLVSNLVLAEEQTA